MELVKTQYNKKPNPYRIGRCNRFRGFTHISNKNFIITIGKRIQFTYREFVFIMECENNIWHFICDRPIGNTFEVPRKVEQRVKKHMEFLAQHFSHQFVRKLDTIQMMNQIIMN